VRQAVCVIADSPRALRQRSSSTDSAPVSTDVAPTFLQQQQIIGASVSSQQVDWDRRQLQQAPIHERQQQLSLSVLAYTKQGNMPAWSVIILCSILGVFAGRMLCFCESRAALSCAANGDKLAYVQNLRFPHQSCLTDAQLYHS
jgi:hypothetical protein